MKAKIQTLFLFGLLTIAAYASKPGNARSGYTFRSEVLTITEDDEVRWDTIVVYLTDVHGQTTKLYSQALPLDTVSWSKGSIGEITEYDWNFDGIPDLQVCTGPMNGFGNYTYDVWLWDDQKHVFTRHWTVSVISTTHTLIPRINVLSAPGDWMTMWKL